MFEEGKTIVNERKRIPTECGNGKNNNFRCAETESGAAHTPDKDGADCAECPNYVYSPSRTAEKYAAADREAVRGSAIGTIVLAAFAVLTAAVIFVAALLIKRFAG